MKYWRCLYVFFFIKSAHSSKIKPPPNIGTIQFFDRSIQNVGKNKHIGQMIPVAFLILKIENDFETSFVPVVMGILSTIPNSLYFDDSLYKSE